MDFGPLLIIIAALLAGVTTYLSALFGIAKVNGLEPIDRVLAALAVLCAAATVAVSVYAGTFLAEG